ncbi:hypothetical protein [Solidesulfovibrio fructosivorans]|nr:hypothetical protein [Solidesulfovibrio fructosivorans]
MGEQVENPAQLLADSQHVAAQRRDQAVGVAYPIRPQPPWKQRVEVVYQVPFFPARGEKSCQLNHGAYPQKDNHSWPPPLIPSQNAPCRHGKTQGKGRK